MRAVASVWPYITTKSTPLAAQRPAQLRTWAAGILPPAWVISRRWGASATSVREWSNISKVWGTPARLVTRWTRTAALKQGSTTDASLNTMPAPTARWECSTDRP
ncbi:MAG: hypothetical protein R2754_15520 [Microthrixaceae bacterium]